MVVDRTRKDTPERLALMKKYIRAGWSQSRVARRLKVSVQTVRRWTRQLNVKSPWQRKFLFSQTHINTLSAVDKAYIAGFLDGEGAICISRASRVRGMKRMSYRLVVDLCNTCRAVLCWMRSAAGIGRVGCKSSRKPKPDRKPAYAWRICSQQAAQLLRVLLPYLRIKKKQAQIALKFSGAQQRLMLSDRRPQRTDHQFQQQEKWAASVRRLNQRGVQDANAAT